MGTRAGIAIIKTSLRRDDVHDLRRPETIKLLESVR